MSDENTQDQRLATADETTTADGIASPLHPMVSQMKLKDTANVWAVHGTVPYSYEGSAGPDRKRQVYHAKRNVTLYVAADGVASVLASATKEMPELTVWSINHQSRNQNGFAIIVSDEVVG